MSADAEYFEKLLAEHGDSPRSLDWSVQGQLERFRILSEPIIMMTIDGPARASILDVGCGLGHLVYLLRDFSTYVGVDISEKMIARAQAMFKNDAAVSFRVLDALDDEAVLPVADYVISSGMLNLQHEGASGAFDCELNMRKLLARCYEACSTAATVNMLSTRSPRRRPDRHYYDPGELLSYALTLTPRVTLRHDYRDNDFTLYLYKERR